MSSKGQEYDKMLGIDDPWIWSGYVIAFASVAFCIVYGWVKRWSDE